MPRVLIINAIRNDMDCPEKELKKFVEWYFSNFNCSEAKTHTVLVCMCGYFRISMKTAQRQLKRCFVLKILRSVPARTTVAPYAAAKELKERLGGRHPAGATKQRPHRPSILGRGDVQPHQTLL